MIVWGDFMILQFILLIVGFILLIKGADIFVDGASNIALNFKVSKMLIGLTIVAFGTSAPEFAVSVQAMLNNNGEVVLGNVIGSNILNILLILGLSSLLCKLTVKSATVKKEIPLTILLTMAVSVLLLDNLFDKSSINMLSRGDGITLLLFFAIFIYYLFSVMKNKKDNDNEDAKYTLGKSFLFTCLGIAGIIFGSDLVVNSATHIAKFLHISDRIISLTVIAFGTSLPELVTSIVSARKGEQDILIGNIIGSNLFNIGVVLALPITLFGSVVPIEFNYYDLAVMILSALMLFGFTFKNYSLDKKSGIIMLLTFTVYYTAILI